MEQYEDIFNRFIPIYFWLQELKLSFKNICKNILQQHQRYSRAMYTCTCTYQAYGDEGQYFLLINVNFNMPLEDISIIISTYQSKSYHKTLLRTSACKFFILKWKLY